MFILLLLASTASDLSNRKHQNVFSHCYGSPQWTGSPSLVPKLINRFVDRSQGDNTRKQQIRWTTITKRTRQDMFVWDEKKKKSLWEESSESCQNYGYGKMGNTIEKMRPWYQVFDQLPTMSLPILTDLEPTTSSYISSDFSYLYSGQIFRGTP